MIRGTWNEAKEAAAWLGERLAAYASRFAFDRDRDTNRLATVVNSTAERLNSGADVSLDRYLEHPTYLSLAVVTCTPNRSKPELGCPSRRT